MTKGNKKAQDRRLQRHREKNSTAKDDKMIGKCTKRWWGGGIAKK